MWCAAVTRRCAKVYKEANKRSFRQAAEYTGSRKVRNSRQARAMAKGTKFRPQAAGSRLAERRGRRACSAWPVPGCACRSPNFLDGVLLMELVADEYGTPRRA